MGLDSLLGSYDSDEETPIGAQAQVSKEPEAVKAAGKAKTGAKAEAPKPRLNQHGPKCSCEECENLHQRFIAKSLQTKGIRFKCRHCVELFSTKVAAGSHFQDVHGDLLQDFKQQKNPKLFETDAEKEAAAKAARMAAFSRTNILRKRNADDNAEFGGFKKKEKPELPPCLTPEYQAQMNEPIFTAPPWAGAMKPTNEDATDMDKEIDLRVAQAQIQRFSKRNVLAVNPTTVRCKLCYKTLSAVSVAETHVVEDHREDFAKEMQIWERFLFTSCKRQPPFGWVCKICTTYFPSDGAVWRHLGNYIFIRRDQKHAEMWKQKEDRWGHEEDGECCGDGINFAQGLSYESVKKFNEEMQDLLEQQQAEVEAKKKQESSDEEDAPPAQAMPEGQVQFIQEF